MDATTFSLRHSCDNGFLCVTHVAPHHCIVLNEQMIRELLRDSVEISTTKMSICFAEPPPPPQGVALIFILAGGIPPPFSLRSSNALPPPPPPHSNTFPRRPLPQGQDEHGEPRGNWAGGKGNTKEGDRVGQTALAENGAERRRRQRSGQKGKNHCDNQNTFGPTEGRNVQWREANRRHQRQMPWPRAPPPPPPTIQANTIGQDIVGCIL